MGKGDVMTAFPSSCLVYSWAPGLGTVPGIYESLDKYFWDRGGLERGRGKRKATESAASKAALPSVEVPIRTQRPFAWPTKLSPVGITCLGGRVGVVG